MTPHQPNQNAADPDRSRSSPLMLAEPVQWVASAAPVDYQGAAIFMETHAKAIAAGTARELIWLLEHPPLYTAGTSANPRDLVDPQRFPVHKAGRGGQYTYHGPGQRVVYVMLDVKRRGRDLRAFVGALEAWLIDVLSQLGVRGGRRDGRVGVWVARSGKGEGREDKIAAIGIRLRRWVSFHGVSLNIDPDLAHYSGIVPCGVTGHGVTSLADLGIAASPGDVDRALKAAFEARFGPTQALAPTDIPGLPR